MVRLAENWIVPQLLVVSAQQVVLLLFISHGLRVQTNNLMEGEKKKYKISALETMFKQAGFKDIVQPIEDKRCESNVMYKFFARPESIVDELLQTLMALFAKKYEPKSRMYTDCDAYLKNKCTSWTAKQFCCLLILTTDSSFWDIVRAGVLDKTSERWGLPQLERCIPFIVDMMNAALGSPFGEANILEYISEVVLCAHFLFQTK